MSYYEILNITQDATIDEIRKAYLNLARLHHPDKTQNHSTDSFREIQQAWEVLRNGSSRELYDSHLATLDDASHVIHDDLDLDDLDVVCQRNETIFKHRCQCGDSIYLNNEQTEAFKTDFESILIPCKYPSFALL